MAPPTSSRTGNLPAELTSFVSRRNELAAVRTLLGTSRLITLMGAGGVGKTRLCIRVASEVRRSFDGGVWFVDLSLLTDPGLVGDAVAEAVGLRLAAGQEPMDALVDAFTARRALLVLDNCEHLLDAVAALASRLLQRCENLRILTTSRQPLGLFGESVFRLRPMSVPDQDGLSSSAITGYESVQLFLNRAVDAHTRFQASEENLRVVAEICRRLDGIPLAIELAAVRVRAMSVDGVLQRLSEPYRLLTGGSRGGPERQRTLRNSIEWSYGLCSPAEQLLWSRFSVFAGGADLEAIEAVCTDDDQIPAAATLDLVQSLIDKSVVKLVDDGPAVRYRMLETIRQFGSERLAEAGRVEELRARHADWYLTLSQQADADWIGPRQRQWFARLRGEIPNLRAALDFRSGTDQDPDAMLELLVPAWRITWWAEGRAEELRRWLVRALARPAALSAPRSRGLIVKGYLEALFGVPDAVDGEFGAAAGYAEQTGDHLAVALARSAEGIAAAYDGRTDRARTAFVAGFTALERADDLDQSAGLFALLTADSEAQVGGVVAVERTHEVLAELAARGDVFERSFVLVESGTQAWLTGDLDRADALLTEGLRLKREIGNFTGSAISVQVLASVAVAEQDYPRAATLLGAATSLWRHSGGPRTGVPRFERYASDAEERVRAELGPTKFAAAFEPAAALTVADAIATALGEPTSAANGGPGTANPLTRREREIAELVAQGHSNRQIAEELVIAVRTAEGHVERILAKLGLSSRTQIARWVSDAGVRG